MVGKWRTRQGRQIPWLRFCAPVLMIFLHHAQTRVGSEATPTSFRGRFELTAYPKDAPA